jgi:hypothetical protein
LNLWERSQALLRGGIGNAVSAIKVIIRKSYDQTTNPVPAGGGWAKKRSDCRDFQNSNVLSNGWTALGRMPALPVCGGSGNSIRQNHYHSMMATQ